MIDIDTFNLAVEQVIQLEGGYVNDAKDPGGETKFGISKRSYPHLEIANITIPQARSIYRRDYWNVIHGNELPSALAVVVFDAAVNHGVPTAVRLLQLSLGVEDDGVLGPETLAAAQTRGPASLDNFMARRALYYAGLSSVARFGLGWFRRLMTMHRLAVLIQKGNS